MDEVGISNLAIGWCGGNPIMTLDDESIEAELCKLSYAPTRDLVLEQKDWTFAASRDTLIPILPAPEFEYSSRFQLPPNFLVVRQVSDDPTSMRKIDYVKEQRTLLANYTKLYLKYTVRITNVNYFSPTFVYALAHKLAAVIAKPLTESASLKQEMETMSQFYIDSGGAIDGTQTKVGKADASKIRNARYRSSGGGGMNIWAR